MLPKILTGAFLLIMLGAVVIGAINLFAGSEQAIAHFGANNGRQNNIARQGFDGQSGQGAGQGRGRENRDTDNPQSSAPESAPRNGNGYGQGLGRNQGIGPEARAADTEQQIIEGIVIETAKWVIKTASGETVQIGRGPSHYRDAQEFVLHIGDQVRVSGYQEDGEFKAAQVTNLDTGDNIILRDASGRPMWAGQGRGKG